ncbi:MAG: hypothetical protein KAV42_00975 [Candidatus Krumholzibacteria bacterium]|nr:hypothetical protein [Candidatus Krumholzibacteria bacterium]
MEDRKPNEFPVSVDGWISSGWHTFRKYTRQLMRGVAIMVAFSLLVILVGYLPGGNVIGIFLQLTVGMVLTLGWFNFCLRLVREEDVSPIEIFRPFNSFLKAWFPAAVIASIVFVGSVLFILPGLYATIRLGMGMFLIVDKDTDLADTLKGSWRITAGHEGKLIVYYLLMMGLFGLIILPSLTGMQVIGVVGSIIFNFFITPLLGVTYASAYDSLLFLSEPQPEDLPDESSGEDGE